MLSLFLKAFDVFRESRKRKTDSCQQFLEELFSFCGDTEAALYKVYVRLVRDADGPRSDATVSEIVSMQRLDAVAQRLQLRVRTAFPQSDVPTLFFELLRRISLAKQSLFLAETPYAEAAYFADLHWIQYQVRRTVATAAKAANIDLTNPHLPFLVGFDPASDFPSDNTDASGQPPSVKIGYDHNMTQVKAKWEAAGHKWTDD